MARTKLMQDLDGHVRHGDHLCVVCDDPADRFDAVVQYVADGLRANERVQYAAEPAVLAAIREALHGLDIDADAQEARGALSLRTADAAYLHEGRFDPDRMYAQFAQAIDDAIAAGYSGCRFGGEPLWALAEPSLQPALIAFEARLNRLFADRPACGMCVYDRAAWPATLVREVLRSHPVAVIGDLVCERNPYYEPDGFDDIDCQVDWMLGQLREIRTQQARLEVALEAGRLGSWELDLATDTAQRSARHDLIFGYPRPAPEWGYARFLQHVLPEDRARVDARFHQAIEQLTTWHFECRIRRADGAIRWIEAHGRPHPQPPAGGAPERLLGIVADVTERKELEQALRETDRRKDEFLATLAHELRNPLAPISNALQLMRAAREPQPAPLAQAREVIGRQVHHLTRLVDDLLDVSRITTGQINLQRERLSLRSVLSNAIEASHPLIEHCRHAFSMSLPSEPVHVDGDPTRLAQVFLNLLNNAARYTPRRGRIELSARVDGDTVEIVVRDNGVGIAPEQIPHMFEMFVQGRRSGEHGQGGLGIGLPLTRKLLALHGGSIQARSDGPGRGSEFIVRLPRAEAPLEHRQSDAASPAASATRRVLVVDDNVDAADMLAMCLELSGHDVRTCYDGEAAIEAATARPPDVAVLDIGLPDVDGYALARRLRTLLGAQVMLVALTGWGQARDRERAREAGFDHHRTKPVDTEELLRLIATSAPAHH